MASLSENKKSFIQLMTKSDEHARRGFELLLKRQDFDQYFDALAEAGLFSPDRNPAPVPVDSESVRIPYWAALSYLVECAKRADGQKVTALANKVLGVVRSVSAYREPDGKVRDNFHTFRIFADILGLLPPDVVTIEDVDLVRIWLSGRFNRDMVAHSLDEGAIRRFLAGDLPEHWEKATRLLRHCLGLRSFTHDPSNGGETDSTTLVSPYWLRQLVHHHAFDFGRKAGAISAGTFRDGLTEILSKGDRSSWSFQVRSAVEDHSQNRRSDRPEDCFIEGLRDVLLGWSDTDPDAARDFVKELLSSDVEMLRRIGIYVLSEHWVHYRELYLAVPTAALFQFGHLHEMYGLLEKHFAEFTSKERDATLETIRHLPAPEGDEPALRLRSIQRRWLSALSIQALDPIPNWVAELLADRELGVGEHPNFLSYFETAWGHGPSPYQVPELVAFAEHRCIVEKLNAFEGRRHWRGPTIEALVGALEQAVATSPEVFVKIFGLFLDAALPYQIGLLAGMKQAVQDKNGERSSATQESIWIAVVEFLEALLADSSVGTRDNAVGYYADSWLLSSIAELLQVGTRSDDSSYPLSLLQRRWALLEKLANRSESTELAEKDPMAQAINSPKGRTLEGCFGQLLMECRLGDKADGSHDAVWTRRKPLFEGELRKCDGGNYEFSTLAGAYFANLEYVNAEWLRDNLAQLFPKERRGNLVCALAGLAYSPASASTYKLLRDGGVLDYALRIDLEDKHSRGKLIERLLLGVLWNQEAMDSPRFLSLFIGEWPDDLEAATWFLSSLRGQAISDEQIGKIVRFWEMCLEWALRQPSPPGKLLSTLGTLAWSLKNAEGNNLKLLLAVAPYMEINHNTHELLEHLLRLVEVSPAEVSNVLRKMVETYEPTFDYEGQLPRLVGRLAELGQRPAAIEYCNRLRNVPGMSTVFEKLIGTP